MRAIINARFYGGPADGDSRMVFGGQLRMTVPPYRGLSPKPGPIDLHHLYEKTAPERFEYLGLVSYSVVREKPMFATW